MLLVLCDGLACLFYRYPIGSGKGEVSNTNSKKYSYLSKNCFTDCRYLHEVQLDWLKAFILEGLDLNRCMACR